MKKRTFLAIIAALTILFTNCEEEETTKVDFNIVVTGESPNAIVQITNTSDSADIYTWEFSEGANMVTSEEVNPQLLVDKTGEFTITLTATIGKKEISKTKKVTITGVNGISIFENVELGKTGYTDIYGEFFSCETGIAYKQSELTNYINSIIDFGVTISGAIGIFSPNHCDYPIINQRLTDFNYNEDNSLTIEDFYSINNDLIFKNFLEIDNYYTIVHYEELPRIILLRDFEGKWGAILFKDNFLEKIIIDVKVQKYLSN